MWILIITQEKNITDSSKPNTGDNNNNNAKRSYRPTPQKRTASNYYFSPRLLWTIYSQAPASTEGGWGAHTSSAGGSRGLRWCWRVESSERRPRDGLLRPDLLPLVTPASPGPGEGRAQWRGPRLPRVLSRVERGRGGVCVGSRRREGVPLV